MAGFIGGSGSTGSSLLASLLNAHSEILCGPETYLFTKHQLFSEWSRYKRRLPEGRLLSYAWHRYALTELLHPYYGWEKDKLGALIGYARNINEFSTEFFKKKMADDGKTIWLEKTPSNVVCFREQAAAFPGAYFIHMIRDPYDTIASLRNRGFNIYYATSLYLLNTAMGLAMSHHPNYIEVRYETLVSAPELVLGELLQKLGLTFEKTMLEDQRPVIGADIPSWAHSEAGVVSKSAIGRFQKESEWVRQEIIYTVNALKISRYYKSRFRLDFQDIPAICKYLGYRHYEDEGLYNIFQLQIDKTRDHITRLIKGYPSVRSGYPIVIWR